MCVQIASHIDEEISPRTVANVYVDRREATWDATVDKAGKCVDRIELVAVVRKQCAAKKRIEKYFPRSVMVSASYGWLESEVRVSPLIAVTGTSLTFSVERRVKKRFAMPNSISLVSAMAST